MITYTFKPEDTEGVKFTKLRDRVITKAGHETEFTLGDMEANELYLETKKKEIVPVIEHRRAVMTNIENNHSIVKELTPEQRHAVHMYRTAEAELEEYEKALAEVNRVLDKSAVEKAEIFTQLGIETEDEIDLDDTDTLDPDDVLDALDIENAEEITE